VTVIIWLMSNITMKKLIASDVAQAEGNVVTVVVVTISVTVIEAVVVVPGVVMITGSR